MRKVLIKDCKKMGCDPRYVNCNREIPHSKRLDQNCMSICCFLCGKITSHKCDIAKREIEPLKILMFRKKYENK